MSFTSAEVVLADVLSPAFEKVAFRVDRSRPLTFVCGGNDHDGVKALRNQFLEHIATPPVRIVSVLAERAFPHQLIERNLQKFESFLADAADCVLIFVESAGSFAETGLFAGLPKIVEKTLVVNTKEDSGAVSFLNLGPIKLIRKSSRFDAAFDLPNNTVTAADADEIVKIILSTYPKFRNALVFHPEKNFTNLALRLQLSCVHIAVTLIHAGSASLITSVLRRHFSAVEEDTVERFLSLLTSITLLQREDELYFNPSADGLKDDFLISSVNFSVDNVRARTLEWQEQNNSQVAVFLREKRGIDI